MITGARIRLSVLSAGALAGGFGAAALISGCGSSSPVTRPSRTVIAGSTSATKATRTVDFGRVLAGHHRLAARPAIEVTTVKAVVTHRDRATATVSQATEATTSTPSAATSTQATSTTPSVANATTSAATSPTAATPTISPTTVTPTTSSVITHTEYPGSGETVSVTTRTVTAAPGAQPTTYTTWHTTESPPHRGSASR